MDPATEPAAFRRYKGAELLPLDEPPLDEEPVPFRPLDRGLVSRLFFDSLAVSAWVGEGAGRYSLRVAPSAGNLHPIESYLIAGPVPGLHTRPALYHYSPFDHGLEVRRELPGWSGEAIFIGLTAIVWRTAWKYGERACRLVHLDAGHAIAAVSIAAAAQGWKARRVEIADADLAALLGVADHEGIDGERPVCLLALTPGEGEVRAPETGGGPLLGRPTRVSRTLTPGRLISFRPDPSLPPTPGEGRSQRRGRHSLGSPLTLPPLPVWVGGRGRERGPGGEGSRRLLRNRRSRSDFDDSRSLPLDRFHRLLERLPSTPLRLLLFVHRVEGLSPGLYLASADGPRLLSAGDVRATARELASGQEAAGRAAFAVAFLAGRPRVDLHWQAGILGHLLYLEAEAAGLGATGLAAAAEDPLYLIAVGIRRTP